MKSKKLLAALLAVIMVIGLFAAMPFTATSAGGTMEFVIGQNTYTVDGNLTQMDVAPTVIEGRTMLPIRFVAEPLGASVNWEGATSKVTIQLMDTKIELWIGQSNAQINGISTPIDPDNPNVKPLTINDRTMLPVRFVAENLGCDVGWIEATQQVTIAKASGSGTSTMPGSDLAGLTTTPTPEGEEEEETSALDDDEDGDEGPVGEPEGSEIPGDEPDDLETPGDSSGSTTGSGYGSSFGSVLSRFGGVTMVDSSSDTNMVNTARYGILGNLRFNSELGELGQVSTLPGKAGKIVDLAELFGAREEDLGTTKTVTMSNKSGIQTIMELGRGYDVFDRYATGLSLKQPILDIDKLIGAGYVLHDIYAYGDFAEVEGSSISEYANNMTTTAKVSGGFMGFKASVESSFSSAYTSKSTSYYHTINWLIMNDNLYIEATANLRNYVLPNVKELIDTGKLNGVAWTEEKIFDTFGGYVLVDGIFGGKLEYNVTADSTYITSYEDFNICARTSYNNLVGSFSANFDVEQNESWSNFNSHKSTTLKTYGGTAQAPGMDGVNRTGNQQNVSVLEAWGASVPSRQVLVEFGTTRETALIPIWELCSNSARAEKLKTEFIKYANDPSRKLAVPVEIVKAGTVYELQNYSGASFDLYGGREYRDLKQMKIGAESSTTNFDKKISSIKVSPGYRVVAYTKKDYEGPFMIFGDNEYITYRIPGSGVSVRIDSSGYSGNVNYQIDNQISSMIVEKAKANNALAAVIYEHADYKGAFQQLKMGAYPNMDNFFVGNDKVSSIKVMPGYKITFFQHPNFAGMSRSLITHPLSTIEYSIPNLKEQTAGVPLDWNDRISSVIVESVSVSSSPAVTIYQHQNYKGNYMQLTVGDYPNMNGLYVGNDSVSSIRVTPGYRIWVYQHTNYGGSWRQHTSDQPNLSAGNWNDQISSMKVRKIN